MFRKPKKAKTNRRRKEEDGEEEREEKKCELNKHAQDNDGDAEDDTLTLLEEARRKTRPPKSKEIAAATSTNKSDSTVMHQYDTSSGDIQKRNADLVTSTVQEHPEELMRDHLNSNSGNQGPSKPDDGIFRDKKRNPFLAGPIKATGHIRTTCRFDYQPDVCKDYKETGFCGFGDTCIYLHDRGDTLTGWQLEKQWEEEQKKKKEQQDKEIQGFVDANTSKPTGKNSNDDNPKEDALPFACHICRNPFTNPVVTSCGHHFCEQCIMDHVRTKSDACPICSKDTHRVFNQATKLMRRLQRSKATTKSVGNEFQELLDEEAG